MSATTSTSLAPEMGINQEISHDIALAPAVLELLASKICHDLISPVGAINNGLELLEEMGVEAGGDAMQLVNSSAAQAGAKLQMFRVVYGAGGRDSHIKPDDIKKIFAAVIDADGKIKQDWDAFSLNRDELPPGFCKLLLGSLMLAQDCLPKGGTISVTQTNGREVAINASGIDAAPRARFTEALARNVPVGELDPRLIHCYVLGIFASVYGYSIHLDGSAPATASIILAAA